MTSLTCNDTIVRRHQASVWRYLRLLGCDDATADDLTQETFIAFMRADFEHVSDRATASWLRKKARFLFLDQVRKSDRRRETAMADAADEVWEEYAGDDDGGDYREALRECVAALPPRSRLALQYRYSARLGREETAVRLGLKPNGVKTLLQRIRASLRKCVERKIRR
jgi:RNA polymerase sigma-70 factor (ECF subfamily)